MGFAPKHGETPRFSLSKGDFRKLLNYSSALGLHISSLVWSLPFEIGQMRY